MIEEIARRAKEAGILMAGLSGRQKNSALKAVAGALGAREGEIVRANEADLAEAAKGDLNKALLKRLRFDSAKLRTAIAGVQSLMGLEDPVGKTLGCTELDEGLELYQVSCPIGVLGIVFESRPDALVQISTLALKSGNAVLLKGGTEAARTNRILADVITQASLKAGLPAGWMALLETRADVKAMLELDDYIDLIIPRGSNAFVRFIMDNTRVAVLGHADGICHVYVDGGADIDTAVRVALDSKIDYPSACNAIETLLVDREVAGEFLARAKAAYDEAGVELRGDEQTRKVIDVTAATEEDWRTEYNDLVLSIRVVDGVDGAIEHINTYGSRHTDTIVTEDKERAGRFLELVDSANVFWNCSTRFADGFRFGLGAEVGISTNKIHARGPVGLEGLVSYKWKLLGSGQIVGEYGGPKGKGFTHKRRDKEFGL